MKISVFGWLTGTALALIFASSISVSNAAGLGDLTFTTHAAFFSSETKQPKPLDPQVFVQDASTPAATGPQ